jgi:hypothetical protein
MRLSLKKTRVAPGKAEPFRTVRRQSRTGLIEGYIGKLPEWRVGNMHGDANEFSLNWIEKVMVT